MFNFNLHNTSNTSSQSGLKRNFVLTEGHNGVDGWNSGEELSNSGDGFSERRRKKKSRWSTDPEDKIVIPGMPTYLPPNLTESQQRQYVVHLQIEEITRKLRTGELGIPSNPEERSPSPEPIYNHEGKRMNTRDFRTRKKLEDERHKLIQEALKLNPDFKPPSDYKPPVIKIADKVMIPQEEHPEINFVGLLIGPRGNTLKNLEKETGAKIIIRGKGSVKDGKIGRKDGHPLPGEDEPLHAYVTAMVPENVKKAVDKIKEIVRQGIEVPEGQNDLRKQQLRELALLNGTLRENDGLIKLRQIAESQTIVTNTIICSICGGAGHIAQDCKQKRPGDTFRTQQMQSPAEKAKMDIEYMSLMAELGEGPPPPPKSEAPSFTAPSTPNYGRPLLTNPPPNPMAINSPWQTNTRPTQSQSQSQSQSTAYPLLNRPAGMQATPQINPLGRLPAALMSVPVPPPPPASLASLLGLTVALGAQQTSALLAGISANQQMQQKIGGMGGSWQQPGQQFSQNSKAQGLNSGGNTGASNTGMGRGLSGQGLLSPPPLPPSTIQSLMQVQTNLRWSSGGKVPLLGLQPSPSNSSGAAAAALNPQQQQLLHIQNQILLSQQQKIARQGPTTNAWDSGMNQQGAGGQQMNLPGRKTDQS